MRQVSWIFLAIVALSCLATPAMAQRGFGIYGPSYGRSAYYGGYRGYSRPYTSYYRASPSYGYQSYGYRSYGYPSYSGYQNYSPNVYSYPVNPGYGGYYSPGISVGIGY